jgi:hypothetical protein
MTARGDLADLARASFTQHRPLFGDTGANPVGWQQLADDLIAAGWAPPTPLTDQYLARMATGPLLEYPGGGVTWPLAKAAADAAIAAGYTPPPLDAANRRSDHMSYPRRNPHEEAAAAAMWAELATKAEAAAVKFAELADVALAMRGPLAEIGKEFGRIHTDHLARLAAADGATPDNVELRG